jgi:transposase
MTTPGVGAIVAITYRSALDDPSRIRKSKNAGPKRRGNKRAKVAVARKLAVILHRMWIDGTTFRWTKTEAAQA